MWCLCRYAEQTSLTDEPDYGLYDVPASDVEGDVTTVSSCDPERDEFTRNTKLLVKHSGREMAASVAAPMKQLSPSDLTPTTAGGGDPMQKQPYPSSMEMDYGDFDYSSRQPYFYRGYQGGQQGEQQFEGGRGRQGGYDRYPTAAGPSDEYGTSLAQELSEAASGGAAATAAAGYDPEYYRPSDYGSYDRYASRYDDSRPQRDYPLPPDEGFARDYDETEAYDPSRRKLVSDPSQELFSEASSAELYSKSGPSRGGCEGDEGDGADKGGHHETSKTELPRESRRSRDIADGGKKKVKKDKHDKEKRTAVEDGSSSKGSKEKRSRKSESETAAARRESRSSRHHSSRGERGEEGGTRPRKEHHHHPHRRSDNRDNYD